MARAIKWPIFFSKYLLATNADQEILVDRYICVDTKSSNYYFLLILEGAYSEW
jgi:hypothetical protein